MKRLWCVVQRAIPRRSSLGRLVKDSTAEDSSAPFEWTCDSCGHQWEDDGITKEE